MEYQEKIIELLEAIYIKGVKANTDILDGIIIEGSGGFFGAFFAFTFGMISFKINNMRKRFMKHKNAVVELEYLLNEHLNDIAKNECLIKHTINILKAGHFTYNRFYFLRIPRNIELRLADLEPINRYFTYKESVQRFNADLKKINIALDTIKDILLTTGRVNKQNLHHIIEQTGMLLKFLPLLLGETKELLAFTRLYLKKLDSREEKGLNLYKLNGYKQITQSGISDELKKLDKEIEQTMSESKKKLEEALKMKL